MKAANGSFQAFLVFIAFISVSSVLDPGVASAQEIRLTLKNPSSFERRGEPMTCGVPLVKGFAGKADRLTLQGPDGKPVPLQIQTTGSYGDGTPRWVLLDFQTDLKAAQEAVYRLVAEGKAAPPETQLSCKLDSGAAEVDTGAANFRIDTRRFCLFDSVKIGGAELLGKGNDSTGIIFEDPEGGRIPGYLEGTKAVFEDAGPLRVVLCVRGRIGPGGGDLPLADYTCRMHFYAGKAEVRVFFTLHNPRAHTHPGNIWDLGSGGSVFMEDFSLVLPLLEGRSWRARVPEWKEGSRGKSLKLYQDSSGGENWRSANHIDKDYKIPVSFRGYRIYRGGQQAAEGHRIDGWLHARCDAGGTAVAIREFWQNFPKALEFSENRIRIGLWPREYAGVHELLGGEQKTHEMLFLFHGPEVPDQQVEHRLRGFHQSLYSVPDAASVLASNAFWPSTPLDRSRYAKLEDTCDAAVSPRGGSRATIQAKWEEIDEFGWRHFGDTFADNERAPPAMVSDFPEHHIGSMPISHFVNEYDVISAVMLQGIRRGNPAWMWMADVLARHHGDICINHTGLDSPAYSHGPFMHTTHDTAAYRSTFRAYPIEAKRYGLQYGQGGGPNAGHTYVSSLAHHYWLTGNRTSREAFLEVAGWAADSSWFQKRMMGDQRGYGNFLDTFVTAFQLTGDRKYYDRALTLARWIDRPFEGLGGTLFVKAAGRFLQMKIDNGEVDDEFRMMRDLLLKFGDLYLTLPSSRWDRFLEQRCFHAEVFCTAFLYAPEGHPHREAYYKKGRKILDEALERFPGRYVPAKTWVMCFANTGAYLKAEKVREIEEKTSNVPEMPPWVVRIRPDHPRLFFNRETWPRVRERALGAERKWYERILARTGRLLREIGGQENLKSRDLGVQAAEAAFAYLMTEEKKYLDLAMKALDRSLDFYEECFGQRKSVNWYSTSRVHATLAWDWLYEHLTGDERREFMSRLVRVLQKVYTARPPIYRENLSGYSTGFYGATNCRWFIGLTAYGTGIEEDLVREWLLWGYSENRKLLAHRKEACGDDGGSASPTLGYAFGAYPWAEQNFFYTFLSATGENIAPDWPHSAWLLNYVFWNWIETEEGPLEYGYGDTPHVHNRLPAGQLFTHMANIRHLYGKDIPEAGALARSVQEILQEKRYSGSWFIYPFLLHDLEDSPPPLRLENLPPARHFEAMGQIFMRSGTGFDDTYCLFTCGGILSQHRHYDALNFVIYHGGHLALDSGTRYKEFDNGQHLANYFAQTVAHNCVVVHQPGEPPANYWGGTVEGCHGGQHRQLGSEVKAFEVNDRYVYVAGDATKCYLHGGGRKKLSEKVRLVTRQLVFLMPRHFIIFDRVVATDASYKKDWLLHAAHRPVISGRVVRADQGEGRLFCRTLLPEDASLTPVGGSGKEFWAAGKNWEIDRGNLGPEALALMGQWRVEVSPGAPRKEDFFLHVIQVGNQNLSAMDRTELIRTGDRVGARIASGELIAEVSFDTGGEPGGRIELSGSGEPLDRELTKTVTSQSGILATAASGR